MNRTLFLLVFLLAGLSASSRAQDTAAPQRIKIERQESGLLVRFRLPNSGAWVDLARFAGLPGQRPYLHPVYDPTGQQVLTQDRPDDHPWQHGIFTGFHRVNGFNYWKEDEGRQRLVRVRDLQQRPESAGWTARIELVAPNGEVVLEEENTILFHAPESPDSYRVDFTLVLRAGDQDVHFGKFFVGGLSIRMPWDEAKPRQTHLNSNGLRGRAAEQQRAAWCSVERPFGEDVFGFAIFDHPSNASHPPAWRVDEQGLINPNVSGLSDWSLPAGQERRFQYQILVYRGPATKERLAAHFDRFTRSR